MQCDAMPPHLHQRKARQIRPDPTPALARGQQRGGIRGKGPSGPVPPLPPFPRSQAPPPRGWAAARGPAPVLPYDVSESFEKQRHCSGVCRRQCTAFSVVFLAMPYRREFVVTTSDTIISTHGVRVKNWCLANTGRVAVACSR